MNLHDWLENPVVRGLIGYLGMFLISKHPTLVKKAVPSVLLVINVVFEVLRIMFPAIVPAAHAAGDLVQQIGQPWWQHVVMVIASTAIGVGLHSGPKNTYEWLQDGLVLFKKARK